MKGEKLLLTQPKPQKERISLVEQLLQADDDDYDIETPAEDGDNDEE